MCNRTRLGTLTVPSAGIQWPPIGRIGRNRALVRRAKIRYREVTSTSTLVSTLQPGGKLLNLMSPSEFGLADFSFLVHVEEASTTVIPYV